jgi:predicted DNA-binding protein
MKTKQRRTNGGLVSLSIRVPQDVADRLKELAGAEYRPVAAEIRRLIEERIAAAEPSEEAAA